MLVHVAVALMMLIALSAFAVDFGLFWLGRGQAQNSADAGAIAGAIGLAYDSSTDTSDTGPAKLSALTAARANLVAGQQPAVNVTDDITFVDCPDGTKAPACIRVNVYRDNAHGNPLPTWFGNLVGVTSQDTKATATAEAGGANATNCLRPWMIPDKWSESERRRRPTTTARMSTATPDPSDRARRHRLHRRLTDYGTGVTTTLAVTPKGGDFAE